MGTIDPVSRHNVHVSGNPEATSTLVFVHGFGTDQTAWDAVAAALGDRYRLVLFDNAGAGKSAPGAFAQYRYLDLRGYAADTIEILDALSLRGAVLVGHSLGAMIALLVANTRPDCCSKLVMIGASPRYLDDAGYTGGFTSRDLDAIYTSLDRAYDDWARDLAPRVVGARAGPEIAARFARSLLAIAPERAFTVLCSIFQSDFRAEVGKLVQPTLLVQSRDDIFVPPAVAEYLHAQIASSTLLCIDAEGHLPHVTAPGAVVEAMRGFLA